MPRVLCQLNEAIRSKDNGTIWQVWITDNKVLLDSLNGGSEIKGNTWERLRRRHALAYHIPLFLFYCL